MKKAIYIWLLCLGGLFLSQQSIAQRGHGHNNGHYNSKSFQKSQKKYRKERAKAYKHYQKKNYRKGHHYSKNDRDFYNRRGYDSRRVVRAPRGRHSYRTAPWANRRHYDYRRHVYFPDYHAFYDARRHGYVYRNRGRWIFSQAIPSFMVGVNWNNVRLQYLQGVPVTSYPQNYYDTYRDRYPAVSFNLNLNL